MRHRLQLLLVLALLAAGLVLAQWRRADAPASAQSLLYLVADSERELTRMPSKFTRISDRDEIALGNRMVDAYLRDRATMSADDKLIEASVNTIGARVAPHARRKLPYQFHYMPDRNFINAFALPGGHVFIGAGLVERMTTEDEVASVLGHEIEHVDHYHCAERLQVEAALRKIPLGSLLEIPVAAFQAGYSKEQELEADREGVLVAAKGGYSANGAIEVFETFDRLSRSIEHAPGSPQQEMAKVAADLLTGYFRSHPLPAERIAQVKGMIAKDPALAAHPEQGLKVTYVFLGWQSRDAVTAEKFDTAIDLATRALRMNPDAVPALEGLAEGAYGQDQLAAAQQAYRSLLARDAAGADRVETWVEARATKLADKEQYDRELALVGNLLEVQPGQPRLLRLAGLALASKGDVEGAKASGETLRRLYPDNAMQFADQPQKEGVRLLAAGKFAAAVAMSKLGLALRPKFPDTLHVLGDAELAQAHFSEAAAAYQEMFDEQSADAAWLHSFTDALGTARPASAAGELEALFKDHKPQQLSDAVVQVETAGLALMAGSDAPARVVQQSAEQGTIAPELLARLAWWYFRAHRNADAGAVLRKALSSRPGDEEIQNNLGWVALEEGNGTIVPNPNTSSPDSILQSSPQVRNALAEWQQHQTDDALRDWPAITQEKPQWRNPAWRTAIYPPHVNAIVQQIESELQRRAAVKKVPVR